MGPLFSYLWARLSRRNLNPSIPAKFALGIILMGIGFAILPLGILFKYPDGQVNIFWVILSYFIQSCGELIFSPIGLSMITELSPNKMVGLMVGIWYFATAIAYSLAGFVSKLTTLPSETVVPMVTAAVYTHIFSYLGAITVCIGIILLFFTNKLKEMIGLQAREDIKEIDCIDLEFS
jgi:POT family proton-dependent oligopeptide transporter